jgi:hypothetical protein
VTRKSSLDAETDQTDSEEKTETRTGVGMAGIESSRDIHIVGYSVVESVTEIETGNVAVRKTEVILKRKSPVRNTTFVCKSQASNALR